MKVFLVLLVFLMTSAYADKIKVKVTPRQPVLNDTFNVDFTIETQSDEEPLISFNPINVEVISRSAPSVSTRATYINGEVSVKRSVSYTYEMLAKRPGSAYLNLIRVQLGDKKISHPSKLIQVLKVAARPKRIFVRAEVNKTKVYVGESIIVRYYLYNRQDVPITNADIKKFPKLDKFLKRFHQESMNQQRISDNGEIYSRRLMYTAQLFGQKPGDYSIDSLSMKIGYSTGRNSLGNFGFNLQLGKRMSKTIRSPEIDITVMPLPGQIPSNYTGLVGKHEFNLAVPRNRFITNEPIEMEMMVSGGGALELFEAPSIISNSEIEEFEKSGDLVVKQDFTAQKKIKYTYLGRDTVTLPERYLELSYFNVESKEFENVKLKIPEIKIAGGSSQVKIEKVQDKNTVPVNASEALGKVESKPKWIPLYSVVNTYIYYASEIIVLALGLLLLLLGYTLYRFVNFSGLKELSVFDEVYKYGVTYARLHKILSLIDTEMKMLDIIDKVELDEKSKVYLKDLVRKLDESYNDQESKTVLKCKKNIFKKLEKSINDEFREN